MSRLLIPLILLIVAVGLFFGFIDPQYAEVEGIQEEINEYDRALDQARRLQEIRDELLTKNNSFRTADLERLEKLVPNNVDTVKLIMDIDAIASRYGMTIRGVALSGEQDVISSEGVGSNLSSIDLSFSVSSTYNNFLLFLKDLEDSLRLVDIAQLNFQSGDEDLYEYQMRITTYWLKGN